MKRFIVIPVFFLALAACGNAAVRESAEQARAARDAIAIAPERGAINGLHIGSSEAESIAAFGRPDRIDTGFSEVEGKPSRTLHYDGIEIYLIGDEIFNLTCRSRRCVTHDGIRVGDTTEKVLAAFGKGEPEPRDDGPDFLRYPIDNADIDLIHKLQDGKVVELELWFDYT